MTDDDAEAEGCFDYTSTALGFFMYGIPPLRNPTLTATVGMLIRGFGLSNLSGARNRKNKSKGVRGLLASVKELFTPRKNGISKRKNGADRSI